jgi:predicted permease
MALIRKLTAGLRTLFGKQKSDAELDEELRNYLDAAAAQKMKNGMSREQAVRTARLEMGSSDALKEEVHSVGWEIVVETFWQDIRFALRMMTKDSAFTAIAIATLALGIGANTAIFSVVNTVLLQPMPYKDAPRLVTIWGVNRARGYELDLVSYLDYLDWKSQNGVFESMGASTDEMFTMTGAGEPVALVGYQFSPDFFDVLGVPPLLGRTFAHDEDQPGKDHVAVLNYHLWTTRFGSDRSMLGKNVTLDGQSYTVIGVMPRSFGYPQASELWTPLAIDPSYAKDRSIRWLRVMARMKPGVSFDQAQTEMKTIASRLRSEYPNTNKDYDVNLVTLRQLTTGDVRPALLVLLCSVGIVLLIACANIANLLLSRAVARQREIAIRAALGASRFRMIRQFLTESILLGLLGGALGLLIAYWGSASLVAMFPTTISNLSIPRVETIPIDRSVLAFALFTSVVTGIIFGLAPAFQASRSSPAESLKEWGRTGAGSAQGRRFRNVLVIAEVALSLVLLTAATLTIQSFLHLVRADLGFNPDHLLSLRVLLPENKYKTDVQKIAFSQGVLERIGSLPGVQAAGTVTFLPLSGWWGTREVSVTGRPADPMNKNPIAVWSSVSPDYFRAMSIPLLKGRYFTPRDNASNADAAILSASLARRLWPNDDPIGRQVNVEEFGKPRQVVGVVGDVYQLGVGVQPDGGHSDVKFEIYVPYEQWPPHLLCLAIRTAADPLSIAKAVESEIWAVDKEQAVSFVETMDQLASETVALQRASMILLAVFAGLAVVLASIGIYGVISYSASRRTHEIGIRMALGATASDILRLIVGEGLALTVLGVAIGVTGALGLTRFLTSLLYGVRSRDPLTFITVPVVLICVALAACYIPARRAMRVDPMVALRYE